MGKGVGKLHPLFLLHSRGYQRFEQERTTAKLKWTSNLIRFSLALALCVCVSGHQCASACMCKCKGRNKSPASSFKDLWKRKVANTWYLQQCSHVMINLGYTCSITQQTYDTSLQSCVWIKIRQYDDTKTLPWSSLYFYCSRNTSNINWMKQLIWCWCL